MDKRFSKATMRELIERRIDNIQGDWHFDPNNGYAQVEGNGEKANRMYGEFDALLSLLEEL